MRKSLVLWILCLSALAGSAHAQSEADQSTDDAAIVESAADAGADAGASQADDADTTPVDSDDTGANAADATAADASPDNAQTTATETPTDNDENPTGSIIARDLIVDRPDTYSNIARREFGISGLAPHLAKFNNQTVDTPLRAGDVVRIPLYVPARGEVAVVVFVKGIVLRGDESLGLDDEVYLNDRIAAGEDGFVSLRFSSGTIVNLQPGTIAEIVRLNCLIDDDSCLIEILTEGGELDASVESTEDQSADFRISTPYASAAVRGTDFNVDAQADTARIGVTEGEIAVTAEGETVVLPTGFALLAREGQPPSEPVALLPPPAFRFVPTRATASDPIVWFPIPGGAAFTADVSASIDGNAVVASFDGRGNQLQIDSVDTGDYYLQLRGVDAAGFKGFVSSTRLTLARVDPALTAPDTTLTRQGSEMLVTVTDLQNDAAGYEIQISPTADFSAPISVDVGPTGSAVFRLDSDTAFARARVLVDTQTVSAFGDVSSIR